MPSFTSLLPAILSLLALTHQSAVHPRQAYSLTGDSFSDAASVLGNHYNYWSILSNGTVDLTRSDTSAVTTPLHLSMQGSRPEIIIEPSRSALVIIDMQNFFLHPLLSPRAVDGRTAVQPTINMINGFRSKGMKVLWTNWGLTEYDRLTIPPSFLAGFGNDMANETFGSDMGTITDDDGSEIEVGRKLWRGAWNSEPYGILGTMKDEGIAAGTDLWFNKNRLSGLWGPQTPLGIWLQENEITTLFFGGVNADQCVWSTFIDAYFKGFDVIYVDDISATTSPEYALQMTRYNADLDGFVANSTGILASF